MTGTGPGKRTLTHGIVTDRYCNLSAQYAICNSDARACCQTGHDEKQQVTRAPRGSTSQEGGNPENLQGLKTMTTTLYLAARFQLWVNRLVARHLEAEAGKFAR